jgi:hypothetical protein
MLITDVWIQRDVYDPEQTLVGAGWRDAEGRHYGVAARLNGGELPVDQLENVPVAVIEAMHAKVQRLQGES